MADLQILSNLTTVLNNSGVATFTAAAVDNFELDLLQNYSVLINKLEQIALGVDASLGNISVDHHELEISLGTPIYANDVLGDPIAASRAGPPHVTNAHGLEEVEYSRVVSDIWIGVILTLLIVCVIFFICACFLYHKFQQWKNSYRTNNNEPVDVCRNCPPNYEVESLPSYTIVSGLPTYDDAIEEFRKAGIILAPPIPIIKIFESKDTKDILNVESGNMEGDNISMNSNNNNNNCNYCSTNTTNGNVHNSSNLSINNNNNSNFNMSSNNNILLSPLSALGHGQNTQLIELTPDQLAQLSQKRLSLQIAFPLPPSQFRRNSRPRVDLRNHLLRSRAAVNTSGYDAFAPIHRSLSTFSLANERNGMQANMRHRGSLF